MQNPVVDLASRPSFRNDASRPQLRQLLRYCSLRHVERVLQFPNAALSAREHAQDLQSRLMGHVSQELDCLVDTEAVDCRLI